MDTQETKVYIAILIGAGVLGIILVYFIVNNLRQQRSNLLLYQSKIKAEITTLERERKRVARDLHDEIGPVLLSVKYIVNSFELTDPADKTELTNSNRILDGMIERLREISNDLLPETLIRKGVVSVLETAVTQVYNKTGLTIYLKHENIPELPVETSVSLYRIMQEIIHNTLKHAEAETLVITMTAGDSVLKLVTEDNGKGFDYDARMYSGVGLRSVLSRAELLGGTMYLDSKAGKGTRYIIEIPLNKENPV